MLCVKTEQSQTDFINRPSCIPLHNIAIKSLIKSFAADVCITQIYKNDETTPIEAVYCFPCEENAAIYSFTAFIADRVITTVIKERVEAQQEYSEALASGHGAYLMEQDEKSNDMFIVSIGALPPQAECRIEIKYVTELDLVNGKEIRFVLPTTIAPRYNPDVKSISSPAGTDIKYVQKTPYTINFECQVEKMVGIKSYSSPSHPIKIDLDGDLDMVKIWFSQNNVHLDRDIIIDLELSKESNAILAVEQTDTNQLTLMAALCPSDKDCQKAFSNKSSEINNEFIFIVDCSGSMEDENKIGLARQALLLFLKSLPVGCLFNIVKFGSTYKVLFESDVTLPYNKENADKAENLINGMMADLGGTEILEPLTWIFGSPPKSGFSRQIIILTDGEVSNVHEVVAKCQTVANSTRIFSFGVGSSPSRSLIKNLARATNGRYVFVPPNASVDIYVAEQLEKALQPSITDLKVKWIFSGFTDHGQIENVPSVVPPVYANDRIILYGLCKTNKNIEASNITVELLAHNVTLGKATNKTSVVSSNQMISRLAAKASIQELTAKVSCASVTASLQERFGSQVKNKTKSPEQQEIIKLSIQHQILSSYTAFIGVENRVGGNNAGMVLREVPIEISTDDKLMLQDQNYFPRAMPMMAMSCCSRAVAYDSVDCSNTYCYLGDNGDSEEDSTPVAEIIVNQWPTAELDVVRHLISLQKFDGLWSLTDEEVNKLSGKSLKMFKDVISLNCNDEVLISLIVLVILERKFKTQETLWKVVANKARKYLIQLLPSEEKFHECFQAVLKNCST